MQKNQKRLNIVDEEGKIIGEDARENIHKQGLLHREIHVWFFTPKGEIIFQQRGEDVETFPGFLDATVGGHVEIGESYEKAALTETLEETGLKLALDDLNFIATTVTKSLDEAAGITNYARRNIYTYEFKGDISELRAEEGKAVGFEAWLIDDIFNISEKNRKKITPGILKSETLEILKKIKNKI